MEPLINPRHEQFAQRVASGKSLTESFITVGYSKGNAVSCALRLSKKPEVRARIVELQERVTQAATTQAAIGRAWVLSELRKIAEGGESESAKVRTLELCGKELGMFAGPAEVPWDGDLSSLSDQQLHNLAKSLEKIADPLVVSKAKRQLMLESGEVIDTTSEPVAQDEKDNW
jgi:phage terminase small subunit